MADTKYLIVGGGCASAKAAVAIRERDKEGRVILVTRENRWPYDRPPLSKNFLTNDKMTAEDPESKDPAWYGENNVEVRLATTVRSVDPGGRRVDFVDGSSQTYEKLVLTTGASPIRPKLEGLDAENVFFLRTVDDAERIRAAIQRGGRAVMIGGGYIGLEVSASAASRGVACTIIDRGDRPWASFASRAASEFVHKRFKAEGVEFHFDDHASSIIENGKVTAVRTGSGKEIGADFVVVGVGVALNTGLAKEAGLTLDQSDAIVVDECLKSSDPNIYAAGDIASFTDKYTGKRSHVEHYMNASWQGTCVGANVAGDLQPYAKVAYFYSDMFDIHMALRGTPGGELAKTIGDVSSGKFVELYRDDAGYLQMGLIVSNDESKLDPLSDGLEELITARTALDQLDVAELAAIL